MGSVRGIIFDIEEFAVYDGPGIRTVVFFKGCPLRCNWCHNPEGLSLKPQRMVSNLCGHCGRCIEVCEQTDECIACGKCIPYCPRKCIRIAGTSVTAEELAEKLLKNREILALNGGGVTFSGGECTMQSEFLLETRRLIGDMHCAIETCGYTKEETFRKIVSKMDLVMFDIKHTDPKLHKKYTGVDNSLIIKNLQTLIDCKTPFVIRIPLIPTVNDTEENLSTVAQWIKGAEKLVRVEILPYNKSAGAKYSSVGLEYTPLFDVKKEPSIITKPFEDLNIPVKIM